MASTRRRLAKAGGKELFVMEKLEKNSGLLLAMMEPSPTLEEEFQQWYDTEHFPERANTVGFLTAVRGICIDGWPRYIALYDLDDVEVMRGPGYAKIAIDNYSRWTERIVARVWGQYRAEGTQIYPGRTLLGDKGKAARIVVWRFRNVPPAGTSQIVDGLRKIYEGRPETAQLRVFRSALRDETDFIGIIELHAPWSPVEGAVSVFGDTLACLDAVNVYTTYYR